MTQWKCFVQTHLLFVTIYGLVWSSSVTFKHKMTLVHFNVSLVTRHHFLYFQLQLRLLRSELNRCVRTISAWCTQWYSQVVQFHLPDKT